LQLKQKLAVISKLRSVRHTTQRVPIFLLFRHNSILTCATAQIAAKAKAERDPTRDEIEEDEDDALLTSLAVGGEIEKIHHTKAQIAVSLHTRL
jgi:hypothetical protein